MGVSHVFVVFGIHADWWRALTLYRHVLEHHTATSISCQSLRILQLVGSDLYPQLVQGCNLQFAGFTSQVFCESWPYQAGQKFLLKLDTLPFSNFQRFFAFIKNTISFWHKNSEQMTWTVSFPMGKHHPTDLALKKRSPHKIQPLLQVETSHALALKCATFSACEALGSCYPSCWDGKKRDGPPKWPHWITLSHIHWWKYGTNWNHVYRVCRVYLRWVETIIQYSWLHRQLSAGNCLRSEGSGLQPF